MSATETAPALGSGHVLVATKLHAPQPREGLVARPELVARLVSGQGRKLALICAPAGWGKTVLLSQWHASPDEPRPFAWVSLDPGDGDPVRFWSYVIAGLQTIEPELGDIALAALPAAGPDLANAVVAPLINDLAETSRQLVLVLDDYHLLRTEAIHASVAFLLHYLPPELQLAIASRADPPLLLAGLRAAGDITEIRAADLRFTDADAESLLNGSLGLGLEPDEVGLLQARTEGWAAGLQLAALSLQAHGDRRAFVTEFAGDDRQVGEYLHEVLREQPAGLREFLVRTSILERMCAPLCDAVTCRDDATRRLQEIERANLFLVPLDSRAEWYRYHHLLRELLRHELERAEPELVPELHRRASAWHLEHGFVDEAITHAAQAGDAGAAGELIARHWRPVFNRGQAETVVRWIARLPREYVLADARLCLAQASLMLYLGQLEEGATWLRNAEAAPLPGPFHDGVTSVEANVAFLEAAHASLGGDVGRSVEAARRAVSLHPEGLEPGRAIASLNLGHGLYYAGQLSAAAATLEEALDGLSRDYGKSAGSVTALAALALAQVDAGDPDRGERSTARAERLVEELVLAESAWAALPLLARGKLCELRGDLSVAEAAYERAALLAARGGRRLDRVHALLLEARMKRRRRDHAGARALAREARDLLTSCPDPGMLGELLARTERSLQLAPVPAAAPVLPADFELSERELTILRLLASELSQREIGAELYVSFNTVKTHTRSIFRKLGVASRADAVARGRELGLI